MNLEHFRQCTPEAANNLRQRVLIEVAQYLLLENKTIIIGGTVRHFGIREMGLGVYEIGLLCKGECDTRMVKDYIPTLKDDGSKMFPYLT